MSDEQTQEAPPPESYPENWDDHAKATAEGDRTIKLKDGQSFSGHIISGPLLYRELYLETGEKNEQGKPKKKRFAVPFSSQVPGYKFKVKYIIEVILTDGPAKGTHRLFEFGKTVADQLEQIKLSKWGSTRKCDITVRRKGSGQFDTEYPVTAEPPTLPAEGNPVEFNLAAEVRFSTAEDLKTLPSPTAMPSTGAASAKISPKQLAFIGELLQQKDMSKKDVENMAKRKFKDEYKSMDDLTSGQASQLIDTLKAL